MIDKDLLNYIKGKRYSLFLITLLGFFGLASSISATFLLSKSVEAFIEKKDNGILFLLFALLCAILFVFFYIVKGKMAERLSNYVADKIRNDIYDKNVALRGNSHLKVQEISQLSSEGIEQLRLYYTSYLPSFFYSMLAPICLFVLFCFFSWKVAIVYLVCVPLIPVSIIMVSKWAKKIFATYWNRYLSLGGAYLDSVSGMKELLIFHYDKDMEEEMKKNNEEFRRITMKVLVMQLFSTTIMDLVAYGGAAIGILLTLLEFNAAAITYQIALFLILVGSEFFLPMRSLGSAFHVAMNGATAGKKVLSLLKEENKKDGKEKTSSISSIVLKDVSFAYPDGNEKVLADINMEFKKGFYSILGDSGCGKSTLARILSKQIDSYEGSIKIDSTELKDLSFDDYRRHVSYISNDSYLLHKSIRDGFRFYNKDITEEEMYSFLEKVDLKERILDAGGLSYLPKEGGSDLSGGEKQRLVLAYYLSTDRDFCIFDETTSNIDKESEAIILSSIKRLSKDHIVLFISHRLSNALLADQLYLFENKKVILEGNPSTLIKEENEFSLRVKQEQKWEEIL